MFFDCFMKLRPKAAAMIKKEDAEQKGGGPPSDASPAPASGAVPASSEARALADEEREAVAQDKAPPSKVKTLKAGHFIHQFCGCIYIYIFIYIYVYGSYYMTYMNT